VVQAEAQFLPPSIREQDPLTMTSTGSSNSSSSVDGKLGPSRKSVLMVVGVEIRKTFVYGQTYRVL